ncbi:hypothetical protein MVEG_11247 [Podila verticillata NRRL 6337]|uniref:Uncharacterized protein n=1 Tax=Podila verticillata NRRL 6337 TaxID=1069443 RepID=A0A086TL93_9FUNG|nr:hypothetical protein MVEG_11247 [Podila verticillata NRRL 6337]
MVWGQGGRTQRETWRTFIQCQRFHLKAEDEKPSFFFSNEMMRMRKVPFEWVIQHAFGGGFFFCFSLQPSLSSSYCHTHCPTFFPSPFPSFLQPDLPARCNCNCNLHITHTHSHTHMQNSQLQATSSI